jgi:hypothetical protein
LVVWQQLLLVVVVAVVVVVTYSRESFQVPVHTLKGCCSSYLLQYIGCHLMDQWCSKGKSHGC